MTSGDSIDPLPQEANANAFISTLDTLMNDNAANCRLQAILLVILRREVVLPTNNTLSSSSKAMVVSKECSSGRPDQQLSSTGRYHICGDNRMQSWLLAEPALTFKKAFHLASAMEAARRGRLAAADWQSVRSNCSMEGPVRWPEPWCEVGTDGV